MVSRKRTASGSMIITSTKLAVIQSISYLKSESRITSAMIASESAAETARRRSRTSQKQLSRPQVSRNATLGTIATSLQAISASAAPCNTAISRMRTTSCRAAVCLAAHRLLRNDREGGMAFAPVPGNDHFDVQHTDQLS